MALLEEPERSYARLCKALLDRITDRARIIETGTESYRFRRTVEKRKGRTPVVNQSSVPASVERKPSELHQLSALVTLGAFR
jgi:hypothetical protein